MRAYTYKPHTHNYSLHAQNDTYMYAQATLTRTRTVKGFEITSAKVKSGSELQRNNIRVSHIVVNQLVKGWVSDAEMPAEGAFGHLSVGLAWGPCDHRPRRRIAAA